MIKSNQNLPDIFKIALSTTANALIEKNLRRAFWQVRLSCNLLGIKLLKCNQTYLVLTYRFALDTRRQFSLQIELYFFANKLLQFGDSSIQKRISCSYLSVCLEFPDLVQLLRIGWKGKHEQISEKIPCPAFFTKLSQIKASESRKMFNSSW